MLYFAFLKRTRSFYVDKTFLQCYIYKQNMFFLNYVDNKGYFK